jgi:hypothetical protein
MIGTTPINNFELPFDGSVIKEIEITYSQQGDVVLQKHKSDCTIEGNKISLKLSQADTFLFVEGKIVEIQLRILSMNDEVIKSDIIKTIPTECLSDEVLV